MKNKFLFLLLLFCFLISQEQFSFYHDNQFRQYYLYEPDIISDNSPLIFVLHGYSGSALNVMDYSNMNALADEKGFTVCYPQGTTDQWNNRFWNVGYDFHGSETVDDIDFITNLALHLQNQNGYNQNNTFVTGMSNGGDMSYMLACQSDNIFNSIAPVAGCMMQEIYQSCNSEPISVLEIHGTNDDVTLWNGDYFNVDGWGAYISTLQAIEYWNNENQCQNYEELQGPSFNTIHHRYHGCVSNKEVWLYEVVGGGHDWPNYASEEIWNFFELNIETSDINGDGIVNILDVIHIINLIINSDFDVLADLNDDLIVDILDIIILLNLILD